MILKLKICTLCDMLGGSGKAPPHKRSAAANFVTFWKSLQKGLSMCEVTLRTDDQHLEGEGSVDLPIGSCWKVE